LDNRKQFLGQRRSLDPGILLVPLDHRVEFLLEEIVREILLGRAAISCQNKNEHTHICLSNSVCPLGAANSNAHPISRKRRFSLAFSRFF